MAQVEHCVYFSIGRKVPWGTMRKLQICDGCRTSPDQGVLQAFPAAITVVLVPMIAPS